MTHPRKQRRAVTEAVGTCHCGHAQFVSRAAARSAARALFPGARARIRRCGDYFHIEIGKGAAK